jgi:hypothetical protein
VATLNFGRVGFVNKGAYVDATELLPHKVNDIVQYNNGTYACIQAHSSTQLPTNISYWQKWADYGIHTVSDISSTVNGSADSQYINYFPGTSGLSTGYLSIKITGLVSATYSSVDLGYMEITVVQDDRDRTLGTNPPSYKFMIKGNMDSGVWYNTQAIYLGSSINIPINVRFTRTATDAYIEIGETTSQWYYPIVEVSHVVGYAVSGYTPIFLATIQASLMGTTIDSIILASFYKEDSLGTPIASASTTTIGTLGGGDSLHITGTTTINSFGVSTTGALRIITFDDSLTLTHNNTSLILPTSANIVTAVGDVAEFICENGTSGYWRCIGYQRKDGTALKIISIPSSAVGITQAAGTNTTQLATTAFTKAEIIATVSGANISASTNGYQKLPSGLIIQWGSFNQTAQSTSFNFPISFPNNCFVVTATLQGNASQSASAIINVSVSGAASMRDSVVTNLGISYIAIGN